MPRNEAELELKVQVSLALLASLPHSVSLEGSLSSDEISTLGQYWSSLKCPGRAVVQRESEITWSKGPNIHTEQAEE